MRQLRRILLGGEYAADYYCIKPMYADPELAISLESQVIAEYGIS
jgi:hypothetical protein